MAVGRHDLTLVYQLLVKGYLSIFFLPSLILYIEKSFICVLIGLKFSNCGLRFRYVEKHGPPHDL